MKETRRDNFPIPREGKLELMSKNLVSLIDEMAKLSPLSKLVYFTTNDPLSMNIDKSGNMFEPKSIATKMENERILPYPFDVDFKDEKNVYIHVYYPVLELKSNENIEQASIFFDIVCHRDVWLYSDKNGQRLVRPYEIASHIIRLFDGTVEIKGTHGRLSFEELDHTPINREYDGIRMVASITTF